MRAVVKLGGALFKRDLQVSVIKSMAKSLVRFAGQENRLVLVAGGGANAREYIDAARKLGADESTCDLIGVQVTQVNANILQIALQSEGLSTVVARELSKLPVLLQMTNAVVMGGLQPGQSTNTVAVLAAEIIRADVLVNATDVDGVYTEDPKKNPEAKLLNMVLAGDVFAGRYELLDPLSIKTLERSKIPARIVSILSPDNIVRAINGENIGTRITYE